MYRRSLVLSTVLLLTMTGCSGSPPGPVSATGPQTGSLTGSTTATPTTAGGAIGSISASAPTTRAASTGPQTGPEPAVGSSSTAATATGDKGRDREISFEVNGLTLHGSLRIPATAAAGQPAALLLAGSGPTDRNGNSASTVEKFNTLANLADVLATRGVASLRYDKLGSGTTGLGPFAADPATIGYDTFVADAESGLAFLARQPGLNPDHLMVIGHSEGALIALSMAAAPPPGAPQISALALLEPPGSRYLDLIDGQVQAALPAAVAAKQVSPSDAHAAAGALGPAIRSIRADGTIPAGLPLVLQRSGLAQVNARFLQQADRADPAELAGRLPAGLPVLVSCSTKDLQVPCSQASMVTVAAARSRVTAVTLTDAVHTLNDPAGPVSATGPGPLSLQLTQHLTRWLATATG